ncbi:MAG TPA: helix-turn-helix transcriptional regulator [Nocardioidaceae bacterium]|nr:helix-turn-helix transcriptional regulator [Nocardioidaceae bacterium]
MATNAEIGTRIGLSHSGVSRIRSGGRIPNLETMRRIEQATGWSIEKQTRAAADGRYVDEFEDKVAREPVEA